MTVHALPKAKRSSGVHVVLRTPDQPLNYRMSNRGDRGEIFLYDVVGDAYGGVSPKQFATDLRALGNVKTIDLFINSEGGDVFDGQAIYSQLMRHPARVVAHVDGLAASIASLIAMAGDEIRMPAGSRMMIHNAWGVGIGSASDLRKLADLLESVSSSLADTYAARTKIDRKKIDAMMSEETWMTAQEAVDAGFADAVDEPLRVAAKVRNPAIFNNLPADLNPLKARRNDLVARIRETSLG